MSVYEKGYINASEHSGSTEEEELLLRQYPWLLRTAYKYLSSLHASHNIEEDAQDIAQQAIANFIDKKNALAVKEGDPAYGAVMNAYLFISVKNLCYSAIRKIIREKTRAAEEVDIAPEKVLPGAPISEFSLGEGKNKLEHEDEQYVYDLTFAPLGFDGDVSKKMLSYQRILHMFKLRLEGKPSNEIARLIFDPESRYAEINKPYNFDDPAELKRASNVVDQVLKRNTTKILQEIAEDVRGDDAGRVNEELLRHVWKLETKE